MIAECPGEVERDRGALSLVQHAGVEAAVVGGRRVGAGTVVAPDHAVAHVNRDAPRREAEIGDCHAGVGGVVDARLKRALISPWAGQPGPVPDSMVTMPVGTAGPDALTGRPGVRPARVGPAPRRAGGWTSAGCCGFRSDHPAVAGRGLQHAPHKHWQDERSERGGQRQGAPTRLHCLLMTPPAADPSQ